MSYVIRIKQNATGEIRQSERDGEWDDAELFCLTEGNLGCDCNRHLMFQRAGGIPESEIEWKGKCSEGQYTILDAVLPDGASVPVDEPADEISVATDNAEREGIDNYHRPPPRIFSSGEIRFTSSASSEISLPPREICAYCLEDKVCIPMANTSVGPDGRLRIRPLPICPGCLKTSEGGILELGEG